MKLGKKALEALQAEIDGRLMPGDELIVAGPVAAEGTAWITKNYYDRLLAVAALLIPVRPSAMDLPIRIQMYGTFFSAPKPQKPVFL